MGENDLDPREAAYLMRRMGREASDGESMNLGLSETDGSDVAGSPATAQRKRKVVDPHAIAGSAYDAWVYDELKRDVSGLDAANLQAKRDLGKLGEVAVEDCFRALYKPMVDLREDLPDETSLLGPVMKELIQMPEYRSLHTMCEQDNVSAAAAAPQLAQTVLEILRQQQRKQQQQQGQSGQQGQQGQSGSSDGQGQQGQQSQQGQGQGQGQGQQGQGQQGQGQGQGQQGQGQQQGQQGQGSGQGSQSGKGQGQQQPGQGQGGQGQQQGQKPQPGRGQQGQGQGQGQKQQGPSQAERQQMRKDLRDAVKQARQKAQDAQDANNAFSGGPDENGGGWGDQAGTEAYGGDIKKRFELSEMVARSPRLREIARVAGRIRKLSATAQKIKLERPTGDITGIKFGDNLMNLLPAELAKLADPDMEDLFYHQFAERSLMEYLREDEVEVGRGPIVVAVDESGSMNDWMAGPRGQRDVHRIDWAMAVVLALLSVAAAQRRDLRLIHFGSHYCLKVEDFLASEPPSIERVMQTVSHFYNDSGTTFNGWMDAAMDAIETSKWEKADVIVLTDALLKAYSQDEIPQQALSDEVVARWHKVKKVKQFRAFGILIGTSEEALNALCDNVAVIRDLRQDEGAALLEAFQL